MKRAFITGLTGQDGSYLAEFLLGKGYEVGGLVRRSSSDNTFRINHIKDRLEIYYGDLSDQQSIDSAIVDFYPDEVYNLAAQSFVQMSWLAPEYTGDVTGLGVMRVLDAILKSGYDTKFYQAGTSEMFGKVRETPQKETTPFYPRSPYGVSKVYGHHITVNYRESYNLFAVAGICFNHESPRRGLEFVTRKISDGVAKIYYGAAKELVLGNIDSKRDWGFAGDYVKAIWMMLQNEKPIDYVVGTGVVHSVEDFAREAFAVVDLDYKEYIRQDEKFMRPAEVDFLQADASKIKNELGWEPEISFEELVKMMVLEDLCKYATMQNL